MNSLRQKISELLNISNRLEFVDRCYQTFLSRAISARELRHHLQLLMDGMPAEAFIYCICKSEEFNGRFEVPELPKYRRIYLLYKIKEKAKQSIRLTAPETGSERLKDLPGMLYLQDSRVIPGIDMELSALSLCSINCLVTFLTNSGSGIRSMIVGYGVNSFFNSTETSDILLTTKDYCIDSITNCNRLILLAPNLVYQTLTVQQQLFHTAQHINEELVFTMPRLPVTPQSVFPIWNNRWTSADLSASGSYGRWFQGDGQQGTFILYNNSGVNQKVRMCAVLTSLELQSEVFFKIGADYKRYVFEQTEVRLDETIYLKPHYNEIPFIFVGHGITPSGHPSQLLKFSIDDLSITDLVTSECTCFGKQAYCVGSELYGSDYYPYMLSDAYIRSQLHKSGFFEVSAHLFTRTYDVMELDTTRYHYRRDENSYCGYYPFIEGQADASLTGVTLYTARRKGRQAAVKGDLQP